jgi:3-dehydroquinate synthase
MLSGLTEIVKHAIIGSHPLWDVLNGMSGTEEIPWKEVMELSMPVKVKIVENDLTEQNRRKVLNFGHTIGHGLESFYLSSGRRITHGQCIALGMMVETKMAFVLGILNDTDFEAIIDLIFRLLRPDVALMPEFQMIEPWMAKDKKKTNNRVGYSLPDGIGSCRWDIHVNAQIVEESFDWVRAQVNSVPFRLSVDK